MGSQKVDRIAPQAIAVRVGNRASNPLLLKSLPEHSAHMCKHLPVWLLQSTHSERPSRCSVVQARMTLPATSKGLEQGYQGHLPLRADLDQRHLLGKVRALRIQKAQMAVHPGAIA